jgi:hypothetical protein
VPPRAQEQGTRAPLERPRDRLIVTMLLPAGSEPRGDDVQWLDAASRPQASASGHTESRKFALTLEARIDVRSTPAGMYQLAR